MIKKSLFNNQMLPLVIQPSADFKAQVNSDILCEWLRNNLKVVFMNLYKHGAILFRGFYLEDYQDFEKCISYIVPTLSDYKGGDSPRSKVSESIYTSTNYPSNYNISLHNEKSYSNLKIFIQFF